MDTHFVAYASRLENSAKTGLVFRDIEELEPVCVAIDAPQNGRCGSKVNMCMDAACEAPRTELRHVTTA